MYRLYQSVPPFVKGLIHPQISQIESESSLKPRMFGCSEPPIRGWFSPLTSPPLCAADGLALSEPSTNRDSNTRIGSFLSRRSSSRRRRPVFHPGAPCGMGSFEYSCSIRGWFSSLTSSPPRAADGLALSEPSTNGDSNTRIGSFLSMRSSSRRRRPVFHDLSVRR